MKKSQFKVGGGKPMDLQGQTISYSSTITSSSWDHDNIAIGICFPKIKANNIMISVSYKGDRTGSNRGYWGYINDGSLSREQISLTFGNPPTQRSVNKNITDGRILDGVQLESYDINLYAISVTFTDIEMVEE